MTGYTTERYVQVFSGSEGELVCDFPAGWLLMSLLFYSITTSCVIMIIMTFIVVFLQQITGSYMISGVKCQVQS